MGGTEDNTDNLPSPSSVDTEEKVAQQDASPLLGIEEPVPQDDVQPKSQPVIAGKQAPPQNKPKPKSKRVSSRLGEADFLGILGKAVKKYWKIGVH